MQGGVGDCTRAIARALVALGADVHVLTSTHAGAAPPSSFVVHPIVTRWDWSNLRAIARVVREVVPQVVHLQYQTGAFGMHPAINFLPRYFRPRPGDVGRAPRRGIKPRPYVVTTFHDLRVPYLFPKAGPVREWVTRRLAQSCDAVIATNDEDYQKLATWNLGRLTLIPIGSNIPTTPPARYDRAAWRAQLGVGADETLLGYFGFLNESKGGETLIRALARLPNAKLLMIGDPVGASDPTNVGYLARVKSLIATLRLTERVFWTGYTPSESVTANFLAIDLCVLPYRDGASYRRGTLMAALAHGCAIVTTADRRPSTGATLLPALRDGENCLLVPPDDPRALAEAIQRAMAAPALRARIGAGARELARHFGWESIARQHLELYRSLADGA